MEDNTQQHTALIVALATDYCVTVENCASMEREEFLSSMTDLLPRLYWEFANTPADTVALEDFAGSEYMDEDYYDSIRRTLEGVMGEDDTFLETIEEDMKYSDTPIAASVSESLADIFQPLYNMVQQVKESEGGLLTEAYGECREKFVAYWSQTLCNVLRPINHLRFGL